MQYPVVGDSQGDSFASRILCGAARFSALSNGLVRVEWSATGQFEDDPTVCVLTRPDPYPSRLSLIDSD